MRRALLVTLLLMPAAQALDFQDQTGDVNQQWLGQEADVRNTDFFDLTAGTIAENPTTFDFSISVAGEPQDGDIQYNTWLRLHLRHGQQSYMLQLEHFNPATNTATTLWPYAETYRQYEGGQELAHIAQVAITGTTASWSVPRDIFIDESGAPPEIGRRFGDVHATSGGSTAPIGSGEPTWSYEDRMPNAGNLTLPFAHGIQQSGAALTSYDPFRASNGEAGTFYFPATLAADADGMFALSVAEVPSGWTIRLPFQEIEVGNIEENFLVQVTVPFAHQHGSSQSFRLIAQNDEALAQISMGMHYVAVPQPSGHHPRLWLHSEADPFGGEAWTRSGVRGEPFMNALEEYIGGSDAPIQGTRSGILDFGEDGLDMAAYFDVDLQPSLLMGLNVTDETTPFEVDFDTSYPIPGAYVDGSLQVFLIGTWYPIAKLSSEPRDLAAGVSRIEGTITGSPQIVEYSPGKSLRIELVLRGTSPDVYEEHVAPYLLPGGFFELPLAEYSDSIADATGFIVANPAVDAETFGEPSEAEGKESPGAPLIAVLFVALAVAWRRRQ